MSAWVRERPQPDAQPAPWIGALAWTILRAKVRIQCHHWRTTAVRRRGRLVALLTLVFPGFAAISALLFLTMSAAFVDASNAEDAAAVLGTLLTLAAIGSFVGSSTAALQSLYLANDLPLLLTLPIPLRVLFGSKLLEAMVGTLPASTLAAVALVAFGMARGEALGYVPVAITIWLLIPVLATSLAVVVVAVVTRSIPARRARLFLLLISLSVVVVTLLAWSALTSTGTGTPASMSGRPLAAIGSALAWLPTGWAARAAAAAATGNVRDATLHLGLMTMTSLGVLLASALVFARTFARSLAVARLTPTPRASRPLARQMARLKDILPRATTALVLKEWLTLFRDIRRLSGVIWPLGIVLVYAVASGRREASVGEAYRFWLSNAWLALVPWGISLGLSLYAFGTERRNIELLRLLPLSPRQIVLGKVIASLVPITLFSAALAVIVSVVGGGSPGQIGGLLVLVAWTSVGFVVTDTAAAAISPNFEADHIQRTTDLVGRAFGLAVGSAFGLVTSVAAARLVLFATGTPEQLEPVLGWQVLGIAPLGWPLVVAAPSGAVLLLVAVMRIAEDSVAHLIRSGP